MIRSNGLVEISEEEYRCFLSRIERYNQERKRLFPNQNSLTPIEQAMLPVDASNEEKSAVEVYEFKQNPPEKYFVYIDREKMVATTCMGDTLGSITFGKMYRAPSFNGQRNRRIPIRMKAINGKEYFGTYYADSGDYARIKLCKD